MRALDPLPFRLLIDRVMVPIRRHFRRVILPVAVPVAGCGLVMTTAQIGWLETLAETEDLGRMFSLLGAYFLVLFVVMVVYLLAYNALWVASMDAVAGRPVSMGRAWRFALRPRVFGTLLVVGVLSFLSLLMCLFPAIYVVPLLSFTVPAMVEEGRFGWSAIRRSVELTRRSPTGRLLDAVWVRALGLLVIATAIQFAVGMTVQLPFIITQQVLIFRDAAAGAAADPEALMSQMLWLQVPSQVLGGFVTAVTWLYWTFGASLLYRETRRQREGEDLARAIDEIVAPAAPPEPAFPSLPEAPPEPA